MHVSEGFDKGEFLETYFLDLSVLKAFKHILRLVAQELVQTDVFVQVCLEQLPRAPWTDDVTSPCRREPEAGGGWRLARLSLS